MPKKKPRKKGRSNTISWDTFTSTIWERQTIPSSTSSETPKTAENYSGRATSVCSTIEIASNEPDTSLLPLHERIISPHNKIFSSKNFLTNVDDEIYSNFQKTTNPINKPTSTLKETERYFSSFFRKVHTDTLKSPYFVELAQELGLDVSIDRGDRISCIYEEAAKDLSFATRYPNYLGFEVLKYPKCEDEIPGRYKKINYKSVSNGEFTPWRKRFEETRALENIQQSGNVNQTHEEENTTKRRHQYKAVTNSINEIVRNFQQIRVPGNGRTSVGTSQEQLVKFHEENPSGSLASTSASNTSSKICRKSKYPIANNDTDNLRTLLNVVKKEVSETEKFTEANKTTKIRQKIEEEPKQSTFLPRRSVYPAQQFTLPNKFGNEPKELGSPSRPTSQASSHNDSLTSESSEEAYRKDYTRYSNNSNVPKEPTFYHSYYKQNDQDIYSNTDKSRFISNRSTTNQDQLQTPQTNIQYQHQKTLFCHNQQLQQTLENRRSEPDVNLAEPQNESVMFSEQHHPQHHQPNQQEPIGDIPECESSMFLDQHLEQPSYSENMNTYYPGQYPQIPVWKLQPCYPVPMYYVRPPAQINPSPISLRIPYQIPVWRHGVQMFRPVTQIIRPNPNYFRQITWNQPFYPNFAPVLRNTNPIVLPMRYLVPKQRHPFPIPESGGNNERMSTNNSGNNIPTSYFRQMNRPVVNMEPQNIAKKKPVEENISKPLDARFNKHEKAFLKVKESNVNAPEQTTHGDLNSRQPQDTMAPKTYAEQVKTQKVKVNSTQTSTNKSEGDYVHSQRAQYESKFIPIRSRTFWKTTDNKQFKSKKDRTTVKSTSDSPSTSETVDDKDSPKNVTHRKPTWFK